ncbi:histidine phosphatase family protein [Pseudochelatococcus contaminans]|uniref:Putative phosphoglycerate mutase n=1 Tax=Pseudochelatococcus contaminans TaxID=1538103 RepID=A0A7W6EF28_9HYPH|nr:putative phosphoglycerate mutase [Pseudochelatococcus contaminans]
MTRPTIYFVRHGETDWNAEARLQGERDVPLNAVGRKQAEQVGHHLRKLRPDFGTLDYVSSPLTRTRETMGLLRGVLGLPDDDSVVFEPRLREIAFGIWEGKTWPEIRVANAAMVRERDADRWNFAPPEGESYAGAARRVEQFLDTLERDTVIVAHGGIARVMLALLAGHSGQSVVQLPIWQGRVLVFADNRHRWFPA